MSYGGVLACFIFLIHTVHVVNSSGNPPVWFFPSSASSKSISESTGPGISVYVAIATDSEGNDLTYTINNQTPASPAFELNLTTGVLNTPSGLDAETSNSFTFEFSVTDSTSTVLSPILTINLNDENEFHPVFNQTSYAATIYDTATNGDIVLTVYATDDDITSSLSYTITVGDSSTFLMGTTSGDLTVATASNFNPSSTPSYTLTVQVSDGTNTDTATASVTVLDDPCSPNPCQNSGTCSSSGTSFTCSCQSGWMGTTCSTDDPCSPSPCENSGTCTIDNSSYNCSCAFGWIGDNCTVVDLCASSPCENNATCNSDVTGSSFSCTCVIGWIGALCDIVDLCASSPCANNATCNSDVTGSSFSCTCARGWIGALCDIDDHCSSSPCENFGTCTINNSSYNCSCAIGWIGDNCSLDDPCLPEPCENSGTCSISGTTYQCSCTSEFSGTNCTETPMPDQDDTDGGLSTGAVVGICLAIVLVCVTVTLGLFYLKWSSQHAGTKEYSPKTDYVKKHRSSSLKSNSIVPLNVKFQGEIQMPEKVGTDINLENG